MTSHLRLEYTHDHQNSGQIIRMTYFNYEINNKIAAEFFVDMTENIAQIMVSARFQCAIWIWLQEI